MDARPRITQTGKAVNLAQLAAEAGAALSASDTEIVAAEPATVTQHQLQAAYDAHIADPTYGRSAEENNLAGLRAKAQAVFAGNDTFTPAQLQKIAAGLILKATR